MGLPITQSKFEEVDYARFSERLRESLAALARLLARPDFGRGAPSLGAEVELSIVDEAGRALPINRKVLAQSLDPSLQLELDRFNLEYNLSPVAARGQPFTAIASELRSVFARLGALAQPHGGRVVPIGILPTLEAHEVAASAMTDLPRYRALAAGLRRLRNDPFRVRIRGEEELEIEMDDVTLEGAATSFQVHLRVDPADFADTYNAVQLATPFALAVGANSPVFLGQRLWDETRVALFKQSVDSRPKDEREWRHPARVSFGEGWVRRGAYELFAESVALFPPLLPVLGGESPLETEQRGALPALEELRLHQGTVWRWNRAIYDPADGGHLRIEMRALPSGPGPLDMVASAAFLVGLAVGLRPSVDAILPAFPFEYASWNFYRAAQLGLDARLLWPGHGPRTTSEHPAGELIQQLLPCAARGLEELGVERDEAERLLTVIAARVESATTPARWQRRMLDTLAADHDRPDALARLLQAYLRELDRDLPVHEWSHAP